METIIMIDVGKNVKAKKIGWCDNGYHEEWIGADNARYIDIGYVMCMGE